jgi:hypothetical protein
MQATVLEEPPLEFGYSGKHQEQRAGLAQNGPADIEMPGRKDEARVGLVGPTKMLDELETWLQKCAGGVAAKPTDLLTLFPEFPGCTRELGFKTQLTLPADARRPLTKARLKQITDAPAEQAKLSAAVHLCAEEVLALLDRAPVDVVMVVRPDGVPEGVTSGAGTGANFHDLLKAALITVREPIQIIRPSTWRGGKGVEDEATRAWNLFTALYYKAGGKPWRLVRDRRALTRCFVGVSFTKSEEGDRLFASVAQVFNELGDGVIVRGGLAERSEVDRQPHLSKQDASKLLTGALQRYRDEHKTLPAALTLHKASAFSDDERLGFLEAAEAAGLSEYELIWLTQSDNAMLVRGSNYYPPLRGTLLSLCEEEHSLYTHGSVPYYKTYPGLHVPRPLGIRPCVANRSIESIAREILSLTKLNWNRARLDSRMPITLLTAQRVGEILRHVDASVTPAPRYANYM